MAIGWLVLATGCFSTADLRPTELREVGDATERALAGRARLQAAAEAAGLARWRTLERTELTLHDVWPGASSLMNPWPSADSTMRLVLDPGTMDSTARFLTGPKAGTTWGIERGRPFVLEPGGSRADVDDDTIRYMLPTVHYLVDLPFRIGEAEHVLDVGDREIAGRSYHVVYATWGSVEPNEEYDQFLLYIDAETGRIDKAEYTFREVGSWLSAASHFEGERSIDGVWVPERIVVNGSASDPVDEGVVHVLNVSDVALVGPAQIQ